MSDSLNFVLSQYLTRVDVGAGLPRDCLVTIRAIEV